VKQQVRCALARALVKEGPCLVGRTFGEPDYKLREETARRESENL
jgi:ABC-type thiamine transport system ATPase subunit